MKKSKLKSCPSEKVALKSLFLGPQAENLDQAQEIVVHLLSRWGDFRRSLYPGDGPAISLADQVSPAFRKTRAKILNELDAILTTFENEIPKFTPRYLGHMFSEISLPALYSHLIALLHNPNNVSTEGSRVGIRIEKEAIRALHEMFDFPKSARGHFTSCGTIANFEAFVRAQAAAAESKRKLILLIPAHAHYSWLKLCHLFQLKSNQLRAIRLDRTGRIDVDDLQGQLKILTSTKSNSFMLVSVLGTTEFGIVDPVEKIESVILPFRKQGAQIWHHIDAAYGGFFACLRNEKQTRLDPHIQKSIRAVAKATSITIDPHKLGYSPYASGAFLCSSPRQYRMKPVSIPYLQMKTKGHDDDAGLYTIEGSRSTAGALSIYFLDHLLGLKPSGHGRILELTLEAREKLLAAFKAEPLLRVFPSHDLNVIAFCLARSGESLKAINRRTERIYQKLSPQNSKASYYLSKTVLDRQRYSRAFEHYVRSFKAKVDTDQVIVLRICAMNPFFVSHEPKVDYARDLLKTLSAYL